jgi:inhibitor of KinA
VSVRIVPAGDSALIAEFDDRIDPVVNAAAIALAASVEAARFPGVRDVVPTFRSVAIYFDPLHVDYDALLAHVERAVRANVPLEAAPATPIRIPVCYGGELGPDLAEVAAFAHASESEVVRLHTDRTYRVFMLGFVAGFAYLGSVDERIAMPRHSTPRVRVPVGSVGIAGIQTGIYPAETPGGWRVIGRTPVKPFDLSRPDPFLLKAGDAVQFYEIGRAEYDAWPSR